MLARSRARVSELVREVPRTKEHISGLGLVPLVVEEDLEIAFDYDEDLVFIAMYVKGWSAAGRCDGHAENDCFVRVFAEQFELDGIAEGGDGLSVARRDEKWFHVRSIRGDGVGVAIPELVARNTARWAVSQCRVDVILTSDCRPDVAASSLMRDLADA